MILDDLSDAELRRRLAQRGVDPHLVDDLVRHRDRSDTARREILTILREDR